MYVKMSAVRPVLNASNEREYPTCSFAPKRAFRSPLTDTKAPFIARLPCEGTVDFIYRYPIPPSNTGATPATMGPCARTCDASPSATSRSPSLSIVLISRRQLLALLLRLAHKPQIAGRKIRKVRENGRQVRSTDSRPRRHRRRILIQRRRRDPSAILVRVVRPAQRQRRTRSIDRVALHRTSQHY